MHPLVRDLYKRVLLIGADYPHQEGLPYVKRLWKKALYDKNNCPSWYKQDSSPALREKEVRIAVARGRVMLREMIGVIQLKKYRTMKQLYNNKR
mmetsp:Transcript_3528/g.4910  ORF Transcript_3528/g.4910 Transcript_3528/m.4910 type:complete len:94 (+) Transcript_3528:156-437(+)